MNWPALIQQQGSELDLCAAEPAWDHSSIDAVEALRRDLLELEETLIPYGLHVLGEAPTNEERADMLAAIAEASHGLRMNAAQAAQLIDEDQHATLLEQLSSAQPEFDNLPEALDQLRETARRLTENPELAAIVHALDGGFVAPAPGGDLLRSTDILPTGRNLHGFDPYRLPSLFAVRDGRRQTEQLRALHRDSGQPLPETVALVLWGSDNMKNEGGPIAQGPRPPRRRAAHGQLWSRLRGQADSPGGTRASAHRRGDHAVRYLPRPAAPADTHARRGRAPGRLRGGARRHELRAPPCAGLSKDPQLRSANRRPAGLQ